MFDPFDFDSSMGRHAFEVIHHHPFLGGPTAGYNGSGSSSGSDFFLCDDNSTDSESCSIYSDQENNDDKV